VLVAATPASGRTSPSGVFICSVIHRIRVRIGFSFGDGENQGVPFGRSFLLFFLCPFLATAAGQLYNGHLSLASQAFISIAMPINDPPQKGLCL
jgi:hypothetical protein